MLTYDPLDTLPLTREHGRRLRAEAAAARLPGSAETRRSLAAALRRTADLLDPAPLVPRPAARS